MFFGESFLNGDCAALWIVAPQEKANMSGERHEKKSQIRGYRKNIQPFVCANSKKISIFAVKLRLQ